MTDFSVKITNGFHENEQVLMVFDSYLKKNFLVEAGSSREFDIPESPSMSPKHHLLVSVSPGAGRLPHSQVELPDLAQLTFVPMEKVNTKISRSNSRILFKIPGGLPHWQLQITAPLENPSTIGSSGPDNVTVGEDEDGG